MKLTRMISLLVEDVVKVSGGEHETVIKVGNHVIRVEPARKSCSGDIPQTWVDRRGKGRLATIWGTTYGRWFTIGGLHVATWSEVEQRDASASGYALYQEQRERESRAPAN